MNLQAAVKGIAPAGGIRPASHITASSVSATKAEPAAHTLTGQHIPNKNAVDSANGGTATDRIGKTICHALILVLGAVKAGACRSRSIFLL
jgi:hypothetical protein